MVLAITGIAILFAIYVLRFFKVFPLPVAPRSLPNQSEWLIGGQLLCLLIWQLTNIRNEEYNVDESTWIANALAVLAEKNLMPALLNYTTARPITVFPLLLLTKLGLPVSYVYIKVMSVLFITLTLWLTFLTLRNLTTARFAVLLSFPLFVFYLTVQFADFLAYNSELVCNVCIVAGVWLYSLIAARRDRLWHCIGVAFLLGLLPFVKFQAVPGGLIVALLCLYTLVRQQRLHRAVVFVAAGLIPVVATTVYCLLTDQFTTLVRNYFLYYFHYAYQYSELPLEDRLSPRNIIYYYRRQYTFAAYWIGLLVATGAGLWAGRRTLLQWSAQRLFFLLLWVVSMYETVQAGTYYEHYLTLTLIPITLLAAVLVYPALKTRTVRADYLAYGYVAGALGITFFSRTIPFERGYKPPLPYDAEVVNLIRRECSPMDRITIWGWADRYYALSQVAPASRYANSVFQMKANAQQAYYLDQYRIDLEQHRPLLFLDAVAPKQFTYDDPRRYAHEQFPAINRFIATNYQLIFERQGLRAYKLKSELAIRDTRKIVTLPTD